MNKKISTKIFQRILAVAGIAAAMYLCAVIGYVVVRKDAPSQKDESAPIIQDERQVEESNKPFPNLPVAIAGTYSSEENLTPDLNDYLVISEGNLVNLYIIDKDGNKIFEKVLEIDLPSLRQEDRDLLKSGIILGTKEALLSLIEDYSS